MNPTEEEILRSENEELREEVTRLAAHLADAEARIAGVRRALAEPDATNA